MNHETMDHDAMNHHAAHQGTDPVCGMSVNPDSAELSSDYRGTTYYFCGSGCKKAFDAEPARYVNATAGHADHHH